MITLLLVGTMILQSSVGVNAEEENVLSVGGAEEAQVSEETFLSEAEAVLVETGEETNAGSGSQFLVEDAGTEEWYEEDSAESQEEDIFEADEETVYEGIIDISEEETEPVEDTFVTDEPYEEMTESGEDELIEAFASTMFIEESSSSETQDLIPEDARYYDGHLYYLFDGQKIGLSTFDDAEAYCESLGGYLAVISSQGENTFLFGYMNDTNIQNAYFGYTDRDTEGQWQWVNGDWDTYTNWAEGEPSSSSDAEDYAMLFWKYSDGAWNDGDFGVGTPEDGTWFICEWEGPLSDRDGDSLPDNWEINGLDTDGDGVIDLHIEKMGADPDVKDVFVEVDWMVRPRKTFLWFTVEEELSYAPESDAMRLVYNSFKNHGINLHIDAGPSSKDYVTGKTWGDRSGGNAVPYTKILNCKYPYDDWNDLISSNFTANREKVFRHAIFINQYLSDDGSKANSGLALGQHFLVANQDWVRKGGWTSVGGTFMHELGHTLGLDHGSCDDYGNPCEENYNPNYLSVMNYAFQVTGLVGTCQLNYSDFDLPKIDENYIYETIGIDPDWVTAGSEVGTKVFRGKDSVKIYNIAGQGIDFNNSGSIDSYSLACDINNDGNYTTLFGHSDWDKLVYNMGSIGIQSNQGSSFVVKSLNVKSLSNSYGTSGELSLDEALDNGVLSLEGNGALEAIGPFTLVKDMEGQQVYIRVTNMSCYDSAFTLQVEASSLCDSLNQQVDLAASEKELTYTDIPLQINTSVPVGTYSITAVLKNDNREDVSIAIPIQIYLPSADEVKQLEEALDRGDLDQEVPPVVKDSYRNVVTNYQEPKDIKTAAVTGLTAKTYTGSAIRQDIVLKYGSVALKENTDYKVTYANNINVGKASVTITGLGSYTGEKTVTFQITKASNPAKIKAGKVTVKFAQLGKKKQKIAASKAFKITNAKGKVTYKVTKYDKKAKKKITVSKKGKVTVKKGLKKGSYKLKVKVSVAGDTNYKAISKTVTLKVKVK